MFKHDALGGGSFFPVAFFLQAVIVLKTLHATELPSSNMPYSLNASGSPYVVLPGSAIDVSQGWSYALLIVSGSTAVKLDNQGLIRSTRYAVEGSAPSFVVNHGQVISTGSAAISIFSTGSVTNAAGGVIQGLSDGIFIGTANAVVVNAGVISTSGKLDSHAAVRLAQGSSVTNQSGGEILGEWAAIYGATDINVSNAGRIVASLGTAINLVGPRARTHNQKAMSAERWTAPRKFVASLS